MLPVWATIIKAAVNISVQFSTPLGKYQGARLLNLMVRKSLFSKELSQYVPTRLQHFAFPPAVMRVPGSPCTHQHLVLSVFWVLAVLLGMQWYQNVALVRISLMMYDVVLSFHMLVCHW